MQRIDSRHSKTAREAVLREKATSILFSAEAVGCKRKAEKGPRPITTAAAHSSRCFEPTCSFLAHEIKRGQSTTWRFPQFLNGFEKTKTERGNKMWGNTRTGYEWGGCERECF